MNRPDPPVMACSAAPTPGATLSATGIEWAAWGAVGSSLGFTVLFGTTPASQSSGLWAWLGGWILFGILRGWASFEGPRAAHHVVGVATLFLPWLLSSEICSAGLAPFLERTGFSGWGQNQAAGALVLFLPIWWVGPGSSHGHRARRMCFAVLCLCALIRLGQLQSRGAWLATASAIFALWGLTLGLERGRLRTIALKLASTLLVTILLMPSVPQRALEALIFEGQLKGPSLEAALTGRPSIWWRSLVAWSDLPFGAGLGASPRVLSELYPGAIPNPGHAHQQWLQLGLELGWLGLGSWLLLWLVCVQPLWRSLCSSLCFSPRTDSTLLTHERAALISAWLGWLVFGLADCLPPAELSSLGLWTLLALSAASRGAHIPETSDDRPKSSPKSASALARWSIGLPLLAGAFLLLGSIPEDLRHRRAVHALLRAPGPEDRDIARRLTSPSSTSGDLWLAALLAQGTADQVREQPWRRLIEHTGSRVALLRFQRATKDSVELADRAVSRYPEHCDAWWWRAASRQTISSWRQGLSRCPQNGQAWLALADLLRASGSTDALSPALDAYERACRLGDPGANACWRGGHLAERLGQNPRAARLFSRSRLPQARKRITP